MIWTNDVFELFFKPSEESLIYYEVQVNVRECTTIGIVFALAGKRRLSVGLPSSSKFGMETAVKLQGTLNKWDDRGQGLDCRGQDSVERLSSLQCAVKNRRETALRVVPLRLFRDAGSPRIVL